MPDFMESITRGLTYLNEIGNHTMQQDLSPEAGVKTEAAPAPETKAETAPEAPKSAPEEKPEVKKEAPATAPEEKKEPVLEFKEYKISAKEKGILGSEELEPLNKIFNEAKVPQEVASKFHDYAEELTAKALQAVNNSLQSRVKTWEEASKKDPEIMNEYGKNQEIVRRYLGQQSHGLVDVLKETGLLNHPEMIKYFIKQGSASLNDQSTGTGTGTKAAPDMTQTVVNMYKGLM